MFENNLFNKRFFAEFIGAFSIVFFGCAAIVVDSLNDGIIGHVAINMTFGIIVMVMIYSFGDISGAHFNPAVTMGFWISKKIPLKDVPYYILYQFSGGILGAILLKLIFPISTTYGENIPSGTIIQTLSLEFITTFFLMLIIVRVSSGFKEKGIMAGVAVSLYIVIAGIIAGPISSSSMNPARSLGPAIISGNFSYLWIFLTVPIIGAILASIIGNKLINKKM